VAVNIDTERAQTLLEEGWETVQNNPDKDHINDHIVQQKLHEVFNASQLTYKYILFTNIVGKATNPDIHYRAMQAKSDLDGAYNARSLGHQVIVDWEKAHGERFGGSNEPFLNKPARDPEFALSNAARSQTAQERLYNLLERLEEKTNAGELDPSDILHQALAEFARLEPQTLSFESVSDVPYRVLEDALATFLAKSGGGERLAAVTAATFKIYYNYIGTNQISIAADHANVPDEFSNAAGDVEIKRDGQLLKAIEVKDKPATASDIQHAITKGQENKLEEYHFLVGSGHRDGEREEAITMAHNAPIELILVTPTDLYSILKFVGDDARSNFIDEVGDFLDEMRATDSNKAAFEQFVTTLHGDS